MAQAPYMPVPNVTEEPIGAPMEHVNADPEMFGSSVGQAFSRLGDTVENSGNEVWNRAIAFQQLDQETKATQAATNFQESATQQFEQFRQLQGDKASPEALQDYQKQLEDTRQQQREALPSPYAQSLFDKDSLTMQGKLFSYGADHAASELDKFNLQSQNSRVNALASSAANARSDDEFDQSKNTAETYLRGTLAARGVDSDTINSQVGQLGSQMTADRIMNEAKLDPNRANDMLLGANARGDLSGADQAKATDTVTKQMNEVVSRNTADGIYNGTIPALGRGVVDIGRAKEAVGGYESGNTYQKYGPTIQDPKSEYYGEQAIGRYMVMPKNLPQWLSQAGMPQMTPQQFHDSKEAQDELFEKRFGQYQTQYGSFNEAVSRWFTGKSLADAQASGATDHYHTIGQYLSGTNANLAKTAPLADIQNAARTEATSQAPDIPSVADHAEERAEHQFNENKAAQTDAQQRNWNTINGVLLKGGINSIDDVRRSSPDASAAVDGLNSTEQLKLQKDITAMQKADPVETPAMQNEAFKLKGLAQTDPQALLKVDVAQLNLPKAEKEKLFNAQQTIQKGQQAYPEVGRTMPYIDGLLRTAGLTDKTGDDYKTFMGAYVNSLDAFQQTNGKGPNAAQSVEIAKELLQSHSQGWGWFGHTDYNYEKKGAIAVPENLYNQVKQAHPDWTDDRIQRAYMINLYKNLHGATPNG